MISTNPPNKTFKAPPIVAPVKLDLMASASALLKPTFYGTVQPAGYTGTLIAQQWVLANKHTQADTLGAEQVLRIGGVDIPFAGENHWAGIGSDMVLCKLSKPAPASCIPPSILPADYANYLPNHSPVGLPCSWYFKPTGQVIDGKINYASASRGWQYLIAFKDTSSGGAVGDSGSPCFTVISGQIVLLFVATNASFGSCSGADITDPKCFALIKQLIPDVKILDLNNYQTI